MQENQSVISSLESTRMPYREVSIFTKKKKGSTSFKQEKRQLSTKVDAGRSEGGGVRKWRKMAMGMLPFSKRDKAA